MEGRGGAVGRFHRRGYAILDCVATQDLHLKDAPAPCASAREKLGQGWEPAALLPVVAPLAALLLTSVLRVYFPGLLMDALFVLAVLGLGLPLLRNPGPWPRAALLCFAALAALYGLGLALKFSDEGVRNLAAILCAAVIFLFGFRNAAELASRRALAVLLLIAMAALAPLCLPPVRLDLHTLSAVCGYSFLILGLRFACRGRPRLEALAFLLAVVAAFTLGNRSLALAVLAGYAAYWAGKLVLRNRRWMAGLAAGLGLLICSLVALLAGLRGLDGMQELDRFAKASIGAKVQSGRQVVWDLTLSGIAASPWLGHGPGAHLAASILPPPEEASEAPADARQAAALSCLEQRSPGLAADCALLLNIRHILIGTGGDRRMLWTWNVRSPLSRWRGLVQGGDPPRIIGLNLRGFRLRGSIPPQLGNLDGLQVLNLSANQLEGAIPPELGKLRNLQHLALTGNQLTGRIPPELADLQGLQRLRLGDNDLSGCVPLKLHERHEALSGLIELPVCETQGGEAPGPETASLGALTAEQVRWLPSLRSAPKVSKSAHNLFLQVGLQTGIPGMAALALLFASLLFGLAAPQGGADEPMRCFALAALVTVIMHSAFEVFLLQDNMVVAAIAWLLLGLGAGLAAGRPCIPARPKGESSA